MQLFAADDFTRRHFQMHFFLGALRVQTFGPDRCVQFVMERHTEETLIKLLHDQSDQGLHCYMDRVHLKIQTM